MRLVWAGLLVLAIAVAAVRVVGASLAMVGASAPAREEAIRAGEQRLRVDRAAPDREPNQVDD